MIEDSVKQQAIQEMIATTYENMGFAILTVNPFAPGVFKAEIIDGNGPKDVLVTVLLRMETINVSVN